MTATDLLIAGTVVLGIVVGFIMGWELCDWLRSDDDR